MHKHAPVRMITLLSLLFMAIQLSVGIIMVRSRLLFLLSMVCIIIKGHSFCTMSWLYCSTSAAAFAQDGSLERDSIHQLGQNRNTSIVNSCPLESLGGLRCVLRNNGLIIEDQIWLQTISIGVVTCNSSISPMFIYSNGTEVERDNLRCPTTVPLGQLNVVFDLDVFFNETINFTVIDVEVSWNSYWRIVLVIVHDVIVLINSVGNNRAILHLSHQKFSSLCTCKTSE